MMYNIIMIFGFPASVRRQHGRRRIRVRTLKVRCGYDCGNSDCFIDTDRCGSACHTLDRSTEKICEGLRRLLWQLCGMYRLSSDNQRPSEAIKVGKIGYLIRYPDFSPPG